MSLNTRDLSDRLDELIAIRDDEESRVQAKLDTGADPWTPEHEDELSEIEAIRDHFGQREFDRGQTLIEEGREFEEHAQDFAKDVCGIRDLSGWPFCHIDWSNAADSLRSDYTELTYDEVTYLIRE